MESSKVLGGVEECDSSESGWTMYIGSPDDDDDDDDDGHSDDRDYDDDGGGGSYHDMYANHEDDSDDSMASDASSCPSQRHGNVEASRGNIIAHFKHQEDVDDSKCGSDKKAKRRLEKQKAETRRKEEREDVKFMAKRVGTSAQSDTR
ncbi:acidic leucine-rich nuclear phosphoprotein 32 family member B-like [Melia azedarach]|uniref:Acidic leucine-rich nuclear phosphoprotein 32 family member B-like n=1 Tax=Melia azedarach TaxID=155640 RepID=A0ACC1XQZ0_MELAZ|nr:acidic leucine-rich nuclear phosphoprotein 32 family member B-like [Melia azedarach]